MKHFSHFVSLDSTRIGLKGPWSGNALAFEKTTGEKVVIITNPFAETRMLHLSDGVRTQSFELEPELFNTILL